MLREHEQSLSMKSLKFNVRCISIDCIPSVNSWYKVKEGISTGTGREQTVKDVVDLRGRAFNIRKEDYEDGFHSGEKGLDGRAYSCSIGFLRM